MLACAGFAAQRPRRRPLIPELQPLAFLAGSCWRGTFANRPGQTDTHCFTPICGGHFIRDVHVVAGGRRLIRARPSTAGPAAAPIRFHYYSSEGGHSAGAAPPTATGIDFPEESYRGADGEMTVRTVDPRRRRLYRCRAEAAARR